jgi:predicted transcriptional regulator
MKNIKDVIYVPDYMLVLLEFNKNKNMSVTQIQYNTHISYTTLHNMKKMFVEIGWVTVEKQEKKHIVLITSKGEEIVKLIYELTDKLGINRNKLLDIKLDREHKKVNINEKENSSIIKNKESIEDDRDRIKREEVRGTEQNTRTEQDDGESI